MAMCGVEIPLKWIVGKDEIGICEAMASLEGIYEAGARYLTYQDHPIPKYNFKQSKH